jgi:hypothetical protein
MSFFKIDIVGNSRVDEVKSMIVEADSLAIAKALAEAQFDGDSPWSSGAEIVTASSDLTGWSYKIRIGNTEAGYLSAKSGAPVVEVEYVGIENDTVDDVGAALVTALNASSLIAGAAYNTSSNVLTIAETTDVLGDRTVEVLVTPPGGKSQMSAMTSTLVHAGLSSAALKVTLVAPTKIPKVLSEI